MSASEAQSTSTAAKRAERILAAAEYQFMTYGMRRTSMDDIAREAGLAKGTLYLSFKSKGALFAALAQRIVDQFRARALEAAAVKTALLDRTVNYLDEAVGEPARLLASTPHAAEILDSKRELASSTILKFQDHILIDVAGISGQGDDIVVMLVEAAHGCKVTASLIPQDFKLRLRAHIDTLLRGADQTSSE